jgi:hypothetical protein
MGSGAGKIKGFLARALFKEDLMPLVRYVCQLLLVLMLLQFVFPQAPQQPSPTPAAAPGQPQPKYTKEQIEEIKKQNEKATSTPTPATKSGPCGHDYYRNVNGVCVHRPVQAQNGVARWL